MTLERIIALAKREAEKSVHRRFRMGAIVFRHHNIAGSGFNKPNKTHPKSAQNFQTIHAELAAILDVARRWTSTADASMLVVRVTKSGLLATSRPCAYCYQLIREAKIRDLFFIGPNRLIEHEFVDM